MTEANLIGGLLLLALVVVGILYLLDQISLMAMFNAWMVIAGITVLAVLIAAVVTV